MVAERGISQHQERIPEKICEQIVDVHVPQDVGQVLEMPKIPSRERILQCTVEQILDVPMPEKAEQLAEVPKIVSQDRIQQRTVEQNVDILVPQDVEEPAEFFKASSKDRVQQRFGGQIIETPAISLAEKIVEVPVIQTQEETQQGVNTYVQHVVDTVEVEKLITQEKTNQVTKHIDAPPLQFTEKVVDIPVVAQRQVHANRHVQKTIQIPQLQHTDQVVDVPVVVVAQVPQVHVVMKTVETSRVQIVAQTTEIPQLPFVEKIEMIPEIETVQGPQTSESLSVDSRGLSHQDCEALFHVNKQSPDIAGGVHVDRDDLHAGNGARTAAVAQHRSTQQHKQEQRIEQGTQEGERDQREEGEKGEGERESVRKGERGKEEGGDAEEAECKQVKTDVTGWTVVTRHKRQKKMVQIFVKVDEAKVTPIEVSLTDGKVEDVMRQVQKDEDVYVTMHGRVLRRNEKLKSCGVTDGCTI